MEHINTPFTDLLSPKELENLEQLVRHNFLKAFQDNIQLQLHNENWDYFISLIEELKQRLYSLVPNRRDLHAKLDDNIPVALISQMIKNKAIRVSDFRGYFTVLVDWLKDVCDPDEEKQALELITELHNMEIISFDTAIPPIIMKINQLIDRVDKKRQDFLLLTSLDVHLS